MSPSSNGLQHRQLTLVLGDLSRSCFAIAFSRAGTSAWSIVSGLWCTQEVEWVSEHRCHGFLRTALKTDGLQLEMS